MLKSFKKVFITYVVFVSILSAALGATVAILAFKKHKKSKTKDNSVVEPIEENDFDLDNNV